MADLNDARDSLGQVEYPAEVREALKAVTELPDDLDQQAEFFDKVQEALSTRLRDESR
ncbi:hypothetical protein QQX09_14125 [Demequina sp. SYSU T00192]|uniref:DUF2795 domain-containing protein n=1 Tax=Demequina litoralis TaxID=3051660 RepID=A0ABT8GCY9_9MICO|nr:MULTISPECIES: hypothetical protein [Demequina]MDN4476993.1 hypothetical protein [Demequina sp. SYSU T00192]